MESHLSQILATAGESVPARLQTLLRRHVDLKPGTSPQDLESMMFALAEWDESLQFTGSNPALQEMVAALHREILEDLSGRTKV